MCCRQHSVPEASVPTDPLSAPTQSPSLHRTQASASHASLESLSLEDPPDPTSVPNGPSTAAPPTPANSTPSASPAPNPRAQRSPSQGLPTPEGLLRSGSRSRSQSLPQGVSRGATPWQVRAEWGSHPVTALTSAAAAAAAKQVRAAAWWPAFMEAIRHVGCLLLYKLRGLMNGVG